MNTLSRILAAGAAALLAVSSLFAADPTYTALRASRPDGRTIAVSNLAFDRDVYHFTLNGTLHLLAPVDGKTPGVVFRGQGAYTLTPASSSETRQLALNAGDEKLTALSDTFESAVFFDAELLKAAEAAGGAPKAGAAASDAGDVFDDFMKNQRKNFDTNLHVRVLESMLNANPAQTPLFLGWIKSKKYPAALVVVDPLGVETLHLGGSQFGGEETAFYTWDQQKGGYWYLSHLKSELQKGQASIYPPLVDAEHYAIDMTIAPNAQISGTTTISLTSNGEGTRVLPLNVYSKVRLSEGSIAEAGEKPEFRKAEIIQEPQDEDADAALVLPAALKSGGKYLLKLTYSGKDVLNNAGDGNYTVGARESWYPNVGTFGDLATFELTYRIPQKMMIVSVGNEVSNTVTGDQRVAVWKSEQPLRVAGFNYGKFKKMSQADTDSGFTVDVYTNPGTPDIIREINGVLEAAAARGTNYGYGDDPDDAYVGPSHVRVDTGSLAQSAMADGINTARTAKVFFGVVPQNRVSITQQSQWYFGQSWPQLIYLPYIAFLDGTTRNTLGLNDTKDFIDEVGPHEFAHQWWGHSVAPKTYHDEWISEGFAEFTAGLVLQQTGGWKRYDNFWERKRRAILEKNRGALITNDQAGPIAQGFRLSTWQAPYAYSSIVYAKGAFVLHMLRMMMQDRTSKNPDERFGAMMSEFAQTYAGKNASTADFQRVAEKHASRSMQLTADGKLDWFFGQWVYGTSIPRLAQKLDVTDAGNGKYRISGTITQSEVPDGFASVIPIYIYFDKGAFARAGSLTLIGNKTENVSVEIPLPRKPTKVVANAMHDVLVK